MVLTTVSMGLKKHVGLQVREVRVARAEARCRPGLPEVISGEEVAVAGLELDPARDGQAGDGGELGADEAAVAGIDAEAVVGRRSDAAARGAGHGVEVVLRVREPER